VTDKDARARIQIRDGGDPIDFLVITGEVLEARQIAESATYVSGGGGGGGYQVGGTTVSSQPISISSRTVNWTTDTIFLKYDDGEMSFKVRNNPMPVRAGNRLSVVYGSWPREKEDRIVVLYNYETHKRYFVGTIPPPYRTITSALIWGLPCLFYIISAINNHYNFYYGIFIVIFNTAVISTIPWIIYRVWVKRKHKKRLQTIFNKIVECLSQGNDLKTLEAA
jgi:hypothetical protein